MCAGTYIRRASSSIDARLRGVQFCTFCTLTVTLISHPYGLRQGPPGDLKHFKGGLVAHIGTPNPNTWKAIRDEHVKSADSLDRF